MKQLHPLAVFGAAICAVVTFQITAGAAIVDTEQVLYGAVFGPDLGGGGKGTGEGGDSTNLFGPSVLVQLDPFTGGLIRTIGSIGFRVNGMTYDANTGTLYGSTSVHDPVYNGLISIDLNTGAGTAIGVHGWGLGFGDAAVVTNLAINTMGSLFGWSEESDDLVRIDPMTGIAMVVGDSMVSTFTNGLAFTSASTLYMINGNNGAVYVVNPMTGSAMMTGALGVTAHHGDFNFADIYYGVGNPNQMKPGPEGGEGGGGAGQGPKTIVIADPATGMVIDILETVDGLHVLVFAPPGAGTTTNFPAINSAQTTGMAMPMALQQIFQTSLHTGVRDLNKRLKRVRGIAPNGGGGNDGGVVSNHRPRDPESNALSKYAALMAKLGTDYRVALGLREGETKTIDLADVVPVVGHPAAFFLPLRRGEATMEVETAAPVGTEGESAAEEGVMALGGESNTRWDIYGNGEYSQFNQDALSPTVGGFDSETYSGSLGVEYGINDNLAAGLAWSYLDLEAELQNAAGNVEMDGHMISAYVTAMSNAGYYADLLYSYGSFENDIRRNTLLGSTATGVPDSHSHVIALNLGKNIAVGKRTVMGPYLGLDYLTGEIDGYRETGGGAANLVYPEEDFDSFITGLGWQVTHRTETQKGGYFITQGRLAWDHEYLPEDDTVTASLATSPFAAGGIPVGGFSTTSQSLAPGSDWLGLGAAVTYVCESGLRVTLDYEGKLARRDAEQHFISLRVGLEF